MRKHALALSLAAVYLFILFFPLFFYGRILSPNDVFYNYDPWHTAAVEPPRAQNPLIHDPPTAYYTLISLLAGDPDSFHWNRYVGSGIPGFGSVAAAVLSPFVAIPALLLPLPLVYSGILLLKLGVSYWFSYLWLREERLGRRAAAVGGLVIGAAGPVAVWWLWQSTNATALYPPLLWAIARAARGRSVSLPLLVLLALFFLLSGYPATIAYGGWLALLYAVFCWLRSRRLRWVEAAKFGAAGVVALLIAAPFLAPYVSLMQRTGYLASRETASDQFFFPLSHFLSFLMPYRLGDPVVRLWIGDPRLGPLNNFVEATVYLGLVTVPLVLAGLFLRRASVWFFAALLTVLLLLMFGQPALVEIFGSLPGIKYSPLPRMRVLLPVIAGFLAAAGVRCIERSLRRRGLRWVHLVPASLGLLLAVDLALFAAHYYPHIRWNEARLPRSETLALLQEVREPMRIAPTFPYLMPNASELYRLEDIRSHWGMEAEYRDLIRAIDPGSLEAPTLLLFNTLRMDLRHPLLSFLNTRFLVEPRVIDILRWRVSDASTPLPASSPFLGIRDGDVLRRTVHAGEEPFDAIDLPFRFQSMSGEGGYIELRLERPETGEVLHRRQYPGNRLKHYPRLYVPLPEGTRPHEAFVLSVESQRVYASVPAEEVDGELSVYCGEVRGGLILSHELRDGRLFENLRALPRYFAVWDSIAMPVGEMLARNDIDFGRVAVVENEIPNEVSSLSGVAPEERRVQFEVGAFRRGERRITTRSAVPFLLVSSEKVVPELRIQLDGINVQPVEVNSIFAALPVPAGEHEILFTWRIGRGWWPAFFAGLGLFVMSAFPAVRRLARR